jgi:hypothetical protein
MSRLDTDPTGSVINWPPGSQSGSVSQDPNPNPKEYLKIRNIKKINAKKRYLSVFRIRESCDTDMVLSRYRLTTEKSEPGFRQTYYFRLTQILKLHY